MQWINVGKAAADRALQGWILGQTLLFAADLCQGLGGALSFGFNRRAKVIPAWQRQSALVSGEAPRNGAHGDRRQILIKVSFGLPREFALHPGGNRPETPSFPSHPSPSKTGLCFR